MHLYWKAVFNQRFTLCWTLCTFSFLWLENKLTPSLDVISILIVKTIQMRHSVGLLGNLKIMRRKELACLQKTKCTVFNKEWTFDWIQPFNKGAPWDTLYMNEANNKIRSKLMSLVPYLLPLFHGYTFAIIVTGEFFSLKWTNKNQLNFKLINFKLVEDFALNPLWISCCTHRTNS